MKKRFSLFIGIILLFKTTNAQTIMSNKIDQPYIDVTGSAEKEIVPDIVTSGSPFVAVRIPAHPVTKALLEKLDFPLAAPSANPFGYISPTTAQHVADQLGSKIYYILDGGACNVGLESTIIGMNTNGEIEVLRKGGLSIESIESVVGNVKIRDISISNPEAPGMLTSHYAPRVPLILALLRQLGEKPSEAEGYEFVLNRGFEKCLTLYPKPVWDDITTKLNRLNRFNDRNRMFFRSFYLGATPVMTDSADRILLQKQLMDYAGLNAEAILIAMDDRIEIWSPGQYDAMLSSTRTISPIWPTM